MAEQIGTYSTLELAWQTVFQAEDEVTGIVLQVLPDDAGGWTWEAFDEERDRLARGIGFVSALDAQAAAVVWWREAGER